MFAYKKQFMKYALFSILLVGFFLFSSTANLQAQALSNFNIKTVGNTSPTGDYYAEYLPPGFGSSSNGCGYPMLIVLHGIGEKGPNPNDGSQLHKVTVHGPAKHIKNGHDMCFTVNGKEECFVVIAPQLSVGNWTPPYIRSFYDDVMSDTAVGPYIDSNRVYLTGLSLGGIGTYWHMINPTHNNPNVFAAFAPIAGNASTTIGCSFTAKNVPMWAFHGDKDNTVSYSQDTALYNNILSCTSPPPGTEFKFTTYKNVGHNSWSRAYNTGHTYHNPNLYEWLLTKTLPNTTNSCPPFSGLNLSGTALCFGDTLSAYSTTSNYTHYYWTLDGDSVGVDSALKVTADTGNHELKLVASNCDCIVDTTIAFSVAGPLTVPIIAFDSVELSSTPAPTYQWYLNDTLIPGATNQTYQPLQNGNYKVVTSDSSNCSSAPSAAYSITYLGSSPVTPANDFLIFPNPSEGKVNIQLWLDAPNDAVVRVLDLRGVKIAEHRYVGLQVGNNTLALQLDGVNFKGPVLVVVSTGEKTRTDRIVIE